MNYEICGVPTYKTKYSDSKKIVKPIEVIKSALNSDLQFHERLGKNDLLKLAVDIDNLTDHNPNATLEGIMNDICDYVGVKKEELSYTTNYSKASGSHHVVIPVYFMKSTTQKTYWKTFQEKYGYGKEIDAGIFDKDGWFRLPNQTKEGIKGTEHIIQRGNVEDFVLKYVENSAEYLLPEPIQVITQAFEKAVKPKTEKIVMNIISEEDNTDVEMDDVVIGDEYDKLLECVKKFCETGYAPDWSKVGQILKNEMKNDGEHYFVDWTFKYGTENKKKECVNQYQKVLKYTPKTDKRRVGIRTLKYLAKQQNPELYMKYFPETETKNIFVNNDDEAIEAVMKELKNDFIYANGQMYMKYGNKWINNDKFIDKLLLTRILESPIYKANEEGNLIPYSQNVKPAENIKKGVMAKLSVLRKDDDLYEKFHTTTKNKLCFKDGVLDMKKKTFTLWENIAENTIYTTIIIERNYAEYFKNPDRKIIDESISKAIFDNLFGDKKKLALQFFARAIAGNVEDKNFISYCGNRDCGKGILYAGFDSAFGGYITPFNLENMMCIRESNKSSDLAKENAWLLPLEYARVAIAQETDGNENGNIKQKLKISNKMMKSVMSGGDKLTARALYKDPVDFTIDSTLCFFGNNELAITESDSSEHHLKLAGVKKFITQEAYDEKMRTMGEIFMSSYAVRDNDLKDKVKTEEYRNAFVYLLYENWIDNAITIPNEEMDEDEDRVLSLREKIFMKFEITGNQKDKVEKDEVFRIIGGDKKKILEELKQMGCVGNNDCKTTITKKDENGKEIKSQQRAFKGLKIKIEEIKENIQESESESEEPTPEPIKKKMIKKA